MAHVGGDGCRTHHDQSSEKMRPRAANTVGTALNHYRLKPNAA
jgi:hypothetical protein